jgi:hypothetical protein
MEKKLQKGNEQCDGCRLEAQESCSALHCSLVCLVCLVSLVSSVTGLLMWWGTGVLFSPSLPHTDTPDPHHIQTHTHAHEDTQRHQDTRGHGRTKTYLGQGHTQAYLVVCSSCVPNMSVPNVYVTCDVTCDVRRVCRPGMKRLGDGVQVEIEHFRNTLGTH